MNWKILVSCMVVTLMVLPYTLALSPNLAAVFTPVVIAAQVVQAGIIFAISIFFGLRISKKFGFNNDLDFWKMDHRSAVGLGVLSGVLIILFSFLFSDLSMTFLRAETGVEWWKRLMASFSGD